MWNYKNKETKNLLSMNSYESFYRQEFGVFGQWPPAKELAMVSENMPCLS